MYLCQGFNKTVILGDQELAAINELTAVLPTAPCLDWAAASQYCGLIKCYIRSLKKNICTLCHILLFTMVSGIMVVCMVFHIIKFVNEFTLQFGINSLTAIGPYMAHRFLGLRSSLITFQIFVLLLRLIALNVAELFNLNSDIWVRIRGSCAEDVSRGFEAGLKIV